MFLCPQIGLIDELSAVGLVPLGFEDVSKFMKPSDFSMDLLDPSVRAVVVGSDRC